MSLNILMSLVGKNLKMFFRSKVSATAVILIPFIVVMLTGFAFNSSELSNIQVGVYSESFTEFTNGVISDFEKDGFTSNVYSSADSCIESIRYSDSQICVIFPKDLTPDVSSEDIVFYVDYSRVNLANSLVNEIQKSVLVRTSDVGEDIAQSLIDSLENVKESLPSSIEKVEDALDSATLNKNTNLALKFPAEDISLAISDLEGIGDDLSENESDIKSDVEGVIAALRIIEESGKELSSGLGDMSDRQSEIVSKLYDASTDLNSIIVSLNSHKDVSAVNVVSPIKTKVEPINASSNNKDYIVPIMFSLIALFGAILLSSTFVLKEKKTKAFFRNFMAPVRNITFILSTYLTCLIIIFIQFMLIFAGAEYILKMSIIPILGPLSIALFASVSVFIAIGMLIGYLFRSDETVIFSSMITAALLMFFSNIILPLENISTGLMKFLKFNPLVVSNLAIKKIILFNFGFGAVFKELLILLGFFFVFFVLGCILRRLTRRIL